MVQDERVRVLQLASDRATEQSDAAEVAAEAPRGREATLGSELRASRVIQDPPLAHGARAPSQNGRRSREAWEGGEDTMQVPFTCPQRAQSRGLSLGAIFWWAARHRRTHHPRVWNLGRAPYCA